MISQPDDGSSDDCRRGPGAPRHQLAEQHFGETDGNDTFRALRGREARRDIARRIGFLSYGITAVVLASIVVVLERDFVSVPESTLTGVTIAGVGAMFLITLARYARTHSHLSGE